MSQAAIVSVTPPQSTVPEVEIIRFPMLRDNYGFLIHHAGRGETAVIDPAEVAPVLAACQEKGWSLTQIWNTHHHADHTGANLALKEKTRARVIGSSQDKARIPGLDIGVSQGQVFDFAGVEVRVLDVSGHTLGHIAYYLPSVSALFCGDAVFALGCGRMFEGTAPQFWESLRRIRALPDETSVYCAHEYTESNLAFARHIDPQNAALSARGQEILTARAEGLATVPTLLGSEKLTNPFLRADDPAFVAFLGLEGRGGAEVFAHLRSAKDHF